LDLEHPSRYRIVGAEHDAHGPVLSDVGWTRCRPPASPAAPGMVGATWETAQWMVVRIGLRR
jgi:hypothetical protein